MLPNLIVIGAAKCGTTSLHAYLSAHPDIAMSVKKELNYFVRDDWREQIDWYSAQFPDARVRGESSPGYTLAPYLPPAAARIHELVPDVRLIYVVRHPVERAVANYVEFVMHRLEQRTVDDALTDTDPANPHICGSRYGSQVEAFLEHFDPEQLLVVDHSALLEDRHATLRRVFEFAGVDPTFDTAAFDVMHNTRALKVRYNDLGMWLIRRGWFVERAGVVRGPLVAPLRRVLSRPIDATLTPEVRATLMAALAPEVAKLSELTGFVPRHPWT